MITFNKIWRIMDITHEDFFLKSADDKLTEKEIRSIQNTIRDMQKRGSNAGRIIKYLQDHNAKLAEKYKAERAFYTELKRLDTQQVKTSGTYLGIDQYKVLMSPHACEHCVEKTDNGRKVFTNKDLKKTGYGNYPPFHPNCFCVLIPI